MENLPKFNIELTQEEKEMLQGKQGKILQKIMKTVVLFGEACGAKKLVPIEGVPHLVISFALPGLAPRFEMMDELVNAGLKIKRRFTVDPRPVDIVNVRCSYQQKKVFKQLYGRQDYYEEQLGKMGLRDKNAFTCTCYLPEVGNIPQKGTILAWSESSAVVFANSVLGARTNRNGAIIDLLCNIIGKTPLFGLLTDKGRIAKWLVELKTSGLPNSQLLGGTIGKKVGEDVPYIVGLDKFLGPGLNDKTVDFLKDMGAACAAIGAVGLYHVENITPEALEQKRSLLVANHMNYIIDDEELQRIRNSYPVWWRDKNAEPKRCLIGCPHLSLRQLYWWTTNIQNALRAKGKRKVEIETVLCAAPDIINKFKEDKEVFEQLLNTGAKLSSMCIETFMDNSLVAREPVITNSNKLRSYTTARFFLDHKIIDIIVDGNLGENSPK